MSAAEDRMRKEMEEQEEVSSNGRSDDGEENDARVKSGNVVEISINFTFERFTGIHLCKIE